MQDKSNLRIAMVAGEASGDLLAAKAIEALRLHYPNLVVEGVGGSKMSAAGCIILEDMEQLAVMGLIEPLKRLPGLFKLRRRLYQYFTQHRPDIFIGIDAPDFNLGLEKQLHQAGIKTVHLVSPSVWAWRKRRIYTIQKSVDMMLTLFPFEARFYKAHHVPVHYVGHPLAEQIPLMIDQMHARQTLSLSRNDPYVAILPGSRQQELNYLAPVFLQAAQLIWQNKPEVKFITSHLREDRQEVFLHMVKQYAPHLPLVSYIDKTHDVLAAADVVMVTSGTATLETMLYKKPMVIAYRMSALTHAIAKFLVKKPIGLPNLIANKMIVPELIQQEANPPAIADRVMDYLDHPEKVKMLQSEFLALHQQLQRNTQTEIFQAINSLL